MRRGRVAAFDLQLRLRHPRRLHPLQQQRHDARPQGGRTRLLRRRLLRRRGGLLLRLLLRVGTTHGRCRLIARARRLLLLLLLLLEYSYSQLQERFLLAALNPKNRYKRNNNKQIVQVKMVQRQQLQQVREDLNQCLLPLFRKMSP